MSKCTQFAILKHEFTLKARSRAPIKTKHDEHSPQTPGYARNSQTVRC